MRFADQFCGIFCDRASLRMEDFLDATMTVLSAIMAHPRFARGFKRRFYAVNAAYEAAYKSADEGAEFPFDEANNMAMYLLDDICARHGCVAIAHPDDPTVMLIIRKSELDEWM